MYNVPVTYKSLVFCLNFEIDLPIYLNVFTQNRLNIQCLGSLTGSAKVVGLHWYNGRNGYIEPDCPALSICYDNGRMQIMRSQNDDRK